MKIARVFPRKTNMSPADEDCYFGDPPLGCPQYDEVHISVCFTWDLPKVEHFVRQWEHYGNVRLGGPAYGWPGHSFLPGMYLKYGVTITSRGCPNSCPWCFVHKREGKIRELPIRPGHIIQDNNLLACSKSHIQKVFVMLRSQHQIEFSGGFEANRITDSVVEDLRGLAIRHIWVSYDHPNQKNATQKAIEKLKQYFTRDKVRCYVLIGHSGDTLDKAECRLREAYQMGSLPFAMRYRTDDTDWNKTYLFRERGWNLLARRWSRPAIIKAQMKGAT